ncbi:hypothetical protein SRHO_G00095200 [Serrasalmus rhombeus]
MDSKDCKFQGLQSTNFPKLPTRFLRLPPASLSHSLLLLVLSWSGIPVMRNPSSQTASGKVIDQRPPHLSRRGSCRSLVNT